MKLLSWHLKYRGFEEANEVNTNDYPNVAKKPEGEQHGKIDSIL